MKRLRLRIEWINFKPVRRCLALAQRESDFAEASRLQYGVIPELQKRLAQDENSRPIEKRCHVAGFASN